MPRTIRTKVYKFNELSPKAQQKAIEKRIEDKINAGDYDHWSRENIKSMETFAELFPINVSTWSYGGRGEGVTFSFVTDYDEIEQLSGIRLSTWLWNNIAPSLYKGKYYSLWSKTEKSYKHYPDGYPVLKSRYSKVLFEVSCPLTGYCADNVLIDPVLREINKPTGISLHDLLNECFEKWVEFCNEDRDSQLSEDYTKEELINGEEDYTKDGNLFNY
jgi:hypothetical protein